MLHRTNCIVGVVVALGSALPLANLASGEGAPHNGLSSQAFRFNALTTNQHALHVLLGNALDESLFSADSGYIARQMLDPHAQAMLTEIVACALNSGTVVSYADPDRGIHWAGKGELGLCPAWPGGDAGDAQRQSCQELVSACVMARVNAMNQSIPISLRSDPGRVPGASPLAALDPRVPLDVRFREGMPNTDPAVGAPIEGFGGPLCLKGAECDWKPAYVGTCAPGEAVQLAIEDPDRCKRSTLRVCSGISGCVKDAASWKPYARFLAETPGACASGPSLSFPCPASAAVKGYYSVMVLSAPPDPPIHQTPGTVTATATDAPAAARIAGAGKYPAPEADVFSFLEGAFYGNLFKPERLKWSCELDGAGQWSCSGGAVTTSDIASCGSGRGSARVPGISAGPVGAVSRCSLPVPYLDMYACYSYAQQVEDQGSDALDAALLNSRICDLPSADAKCFAHPLRRCHYKDTVVNQTKGAHCDFIGNDGAYGHCPGQDGDSEMYHNIITTYLNQPDDLIGDAELAARLRRSMPPVTQAPGGVPPVAVRRCGCASGAADGGLWSVPLAALVLLVVRGRRRRDAEHRAG